MSAAATPDEPVEDLKGFVGKCREAAEYLRLIQHSRNCNGSCSNVSVCNGTKELLVHLEVCQEPCSKRGCKQTKKILEHYQSCKSSRQHAFLTGSPHKFCLICSLAVRDEGHAKSPSQSINYESSESIVKLRPRKSSDTDFEIPLLPKRFREFGSGSSVNTGGIASVESSAACSSSSSVERNRSFSSPVDIATRLSSTDGEVGHNPSAGGDDCNSVGASELPVARCILGTYQAELEPEVETCQSKNYATAKSQRSPSANNCAESTGTASAMALQESSSARIKDGGVDIQLYDPRPSTEVVVVVAVESEDEENEANDSSSDDGERESEFLYSSSNPAQATLTRLLRSPSSTHSPRCRRLSL